MLSFKDCEHGNLYRKALQRAGKDFTIMNVLPSGVYQYRFLVDGQWIYSPDQPWIRDDSGNGYNILDLQVSFLSSFVLCTVSYFTKAILHVRDQVYEIYRFIIININTRHF